MQYCTLCSEQIIENMGALHVCRLKCGPAWIVIEFKESRPHGRSSFIPADQGVASTAFPNNNPVCTNPQAKYGF